MLPAEDERSLPFQIREYSEAELNTGVEKVSGF